MRKLAVVFGLIIHLCTSAYAGKGNGIPTTTYDCKMTIDPNQPTMGAPQFHCAPNGSTQGGTIIYGANGGGGGGTVNYGSSGGGGGMPNHSSSALPGSINLGSAPVGWNWNGPNGSWGPGNGSGTTPYAGHQHDTVGCMNQKRHAEEGYARLNYANKIITEATDAISKIPEIYNSRFVQQRKRAEAGLPVEEVQILECIANAEELYFEAQRAFDIKFGNDMDIVNNPKHDSDLGKVGRSCQAKIAKAKEQIDEMIRVFGPGKDVIDMVYEETVREKELKKEHEDLWASEKKFDQSPEGKAAYEARDHVLKQSQYAREKVDKLEGISINRPAADFVRDQLDTSEGLAKDAVQYAKGGISASAKLMMDLALDTVHATHRFLDGAANGFYGSFATASDALVAIIKDPTLVTNLSNNLMYMVTGGPGAVWDQAKESFNHVATTLNHFHEVMAYGNDYERGEAIGHLAADLLLEAFPLHAAIKMPYKHIKWLGPPINKNIHNLAKNLRLVNHRKINREIYNRLNSHPMTMELIRRNTSWTNETIKSMVDHLDKLIEVRKIYNAGMQDLRTVKEMMKNAPRKDLAEVMHEKRRDIGRIMKNKTPPEIRGDIYERNLKKYGDELGPSFQWLLDHGRTYEDIIESSMRTDYTVNRFFEIAEEIKEDVIAQQKLIKSIDWNKAQDLFVRTINKWL